MTSGKHGVEIIPPAPFNELSGEQKQALYNFAHKLEMHGPKAGVIFNKLEVRKPGETTHRSFGVFADHDGRLTMQTDIKVLMGCAHIDLEGLIGHEASHLVRQTNVSGHKLMVLEKLFTSLDGLHAELSPMPQEMAEQKLQARFGSVGNFETFLHQFKDEVDPALSMMEKIRKTHKVTPEAFARNMEEKNGAHDDIKKVESMLPGLDYLATAAAKLDPQAKPARTSSARAGKLGNALTLLREIVKDGHMADIRNFEKAYAYADEYVADADGAKNASNPYSMPEILSWFASNRTNLSNNMKDGPQHPAHVRRIRRLDHIIKHGSPPADEVLRPEGFAGKYAAGKDDDSHVRGK